MRRHLVIALSLASLSYFGAWRELLSPQGLSYAYYWKDYPGYELLAAMFINVLGLAGLFLLGFYLCKRWRLTNELNVAHIVFLFVFFRTINNIRAQFETLSTTHLRLVFGKVSYAVAVGLIIVLIGVAVKRFGLVRVARGAALVALIWSPFGFLGFVQASWLAVKYGREIYKERTPAQPFTVQDKDRPRVVWIIFDEMGQRLPFSERPVDLSMPEFDRLRAQSLFATSAFPPAGHTSQSIPALLIGQLIAGVKPVGPDQLMLTLPTQTAPIKWSDTRTVFAEARAMGLNTELVGWYHPYCRVIGDQLTHCYWQPASQRLELPLLSLKKDLLRQDVGVIKLIPFTAILQEELLATQKRDYRSEHLKDYSELIQRATRAVGDKKSDLLFIHLPVPHPPYVFDRKNGVPVTKQQSSILDNLALADQTLGQLRRQMEISGEWDKTTVIVSSDHWWRSDYWQAQAVFWNDSDLTLKARQVDHRVPFIVKLAGQITAIDYDAPFNTVLTHDLILAVLNGEVSDATQVPTWLDAHRTIGESPYQSYEDNE